MANRTRPIILRCAVTEYEKRLISGKMQQIGTKNFGAYARKMLIDGYIIKAVSYTHLGNDELRHTNADGSNRGANSLCASRS